MKNSKVIFLTKIQNYIRENRLLTDGGKIIVGVSGGADSTALLNVLYSLGYQIVAAHCNFHLRGEESVRDESFVRAMAEKMHLPFVVKHFDTESYATNHKISIEMAARDLRYEWFENLRAELSAETIVVAHHTDDNIETALLNLIRGTGIKGLCGMPVRNGNVVRPLLCCSRTEILTYLAENEIKFVTDTSNNEDTYKRNRIRNVIIPELEKINPSVRKTLYDNILKFTQTEEFFIEKIEEIKSQIIMGDCFVPHNYGQHNFNTLLQKTKQSAGNQTIININLLLQQKNYKIILYEILTNYGFSARTIYNAEKSLQKNSGQIFYSETHKLLHDRGFLIVSEKNISESKKTSFINENDTEIFEPMHLSIKKFPKTADFKISKNPNIACFDADKLTFPLTVRQWQSGDFFIPFGMKNCKKLSNFFIDNKISRFEKEKIFVLLSDENIAWVVGQRISENFKITEKTKNICKIALK